MQEHTIRFARPEDLPALWPMVCRAVEKMNEEGNRQWGPDYPTRAHFEGDISRGELLAAYSPEGRIVGVVCATTAPEASYEDVPWTMTGPALVIHRMVVDPEARRLGVASALMECAEDWARAQGARTAHVDTYTHNEKMQTFFLSRGFVQRGTIRLRGRPLPYPAFEKAL